MIVNQHFHVSKAQHHSAQTPCMHIVPHPYNLLSLVHRLYSNKFVCLQHMSVTPVLVQAAQSSSSSQAKLCYTASLHDPLAPDLAATQPGTHKMGLPDHISLTKIVLFLTSHGRVGQHTHTHSHTCPAGFAGSVWRQLPQLGAMVRMG